MTFQKYSLPPSMELPKRVSSRSKSSSSLQSTSRGSDNAKYRYQRQAKQYYNEPVSRSSNPPTGPMQQPPPSYPHSRNEITPPTAASTAHSTHRPYKGFSTPFCGMFQSLGGISGSFKYNDNNNTTEGLCKSEDEDDADQIELRNERLHSSHRTDMCSLVCCGLLQSDMTRYLFTHTRPPSFFKRMCLHIFTPLGIFLFAGWCAGNIVDDYANSVVCTALVWAVFAWIVSSCVRGRKKRVMVREEILWALKKRDDRMMKMMMQRRINRKDGVINSSLTTPEEDDEDYEYLSEDEDGYVDRSSLFGQTRCEMNCAHRMIGCYPSDLARGSKKQQNNLSFDENADYVLQHVHQPQQQKEDFCSRLWNIFSYPCFPCIPCGNNSYGCHLQCCGLCALAQEAREANYALPRYLRMLDYITMESYIAYYPRIVELRSEGNGSFFSHCRALSSLSTMLLQAWTVVLSALLGLSLVNTIAYWKIADMAILFATFLQAFAVMYFVHWGWHRFDLSIDAVIKYFACGFVLCTGMAFTVEMFEVLAARLILMGVVWYMGVKEVKDEGYGGDGSVWLSRDNWKDLYEQYSQRASEYGGDIGDKAQSGWSNVHSKFSQYSFSTDDEDDRRYLADDNDVLQGFFQRHPAAMIAYIFFSSYLMAGLIEEVCKYFGFIMVDHPDFCSEKELTKAKEVMPLYILYDQEDDDSTKQESTTTMGNSGGSGSQGSTPMTPKTATKAALTKETPLINFDPTLHRRSLNSIRSGVTVAMVAVALGFACCENLLYIFVYNRSSVASEIATLVVRSLFPVHPLAAAMQSIDVCRRDLENEPSVGLGWIVFPAVLFHGSYDFAILMVTSSWQQNHKENYFGEGDDGLLVAVESFLISFAIVILGAVYYAVRSRAQHKRLQNRCNTNAATRRNSSFMA